MSAADQCEILFNQVDDLGAGIAALGDLLQVGKDGALPSTINGIGIVLLQLGGIMRGLNSQFISESYRGIVDMEQKEMREAAARKEADDKAELAERIRLEKAEIAKTPLGAAFFESLEKILEEKEGKQGKQGRRPVALKR